MGQGLSLGPIQTSWVFSRSSPPFHCPDGSKFSMPFLPPWASQDLQVTGQHPTTSGSREGGLNPRHHQKKKSMRTFEFEPLKIQHFCHHQPRVRVFPKPTWDRPCSSQPSAPLSVRLVRPLGFPCNFHPKPKALHYTAADGNINTFLKWNSH